MSAKKHLILISGLLCNEQLWSEVIAHLPADIEVHIADITQQDNMHDMALAVRAMIKQQKISGSVSVVGFSLGGWVAMEWLKQAPEQIERLVILSAALMPLKTETKISMQLGIEEIKAGRFEAFINKVYPLYVTQKNVDNLVVKNKMLKMMKAVGPEVALRQFNALLTFELPFSTVCQAPCKKLVVVGEFEKRMDIETCERLAGKLLNTQFVRIANAAHFVPLENPVALAQTLAALL